MQITTIFAQKYPACNKELGDMKNVFKLDPNRKKNIVSNRIASKRNQMPYLTVFKVSILNMFWQRNYYY